LNKVLDLVPTCKKRLERISAELEFQDRAECSNRYILKSGSVRSERNRLISISCEGKRCWQTRLGGYILKIVSERGLSIKIEEQSITPTTPIPPVQGGRSPKDHWDKGQGWIPEGQVRGVRGSISKTVHNAIWDSNIQEKTFTPPPPGPQ
jgi:hypothetical protein